MIYLVRQQANSTQELCVVLCNVDRLAKVVLFDAPPALMESLEFKVYLQSDEEEEEDLSGEEEEESRSDEEEEEAEEEGFSGEDGG
jgi:hypothetical protein